MAAAAPYGADLLHLTLDAVWTSSTYFQHLFWHYTLSCSGLPCFCVSTDGQPLLNEYNCPLLTLSKTVFCTSSTNVLRSVSLVHEYAESCNFKTAVCVQRVERQDTVCNVFLHCHDWNNPFNCYSVFCVY